MQFLQPLDFYFFFFSLISLCVFKLGICVSPDGRSTWELINQIMAWFWVELNKRRLESGLEKNNLGEWAWDEALQWEHRWIEVIKWENNKAWEGEHQFWGCCFGNSVCRCQMLTWMGGNAKLSIPLDLLNVQSRAVENQSVGICGLCLPHSSF